MLLNNDITSKRLGASEIIKRLKVKNGYDKKNKFCVL